MEILDPRLPENLLPKSRIQEFAEELCDLTLVESIDRHVEDAITRSPVQNLSAQDLTETMRCYKTIYRTGEMLNRVILDGLGRSEQHILAEICRINYETQALAETKNLETAKLEKPINPYVNIGYGVPGYWIPLDMTVMIPTIDGRSAASPRVTYLARQEVAARPPFHSVWKEVFSSLFTRIDSTEPMALIEPPFTLNSGEIVADTSPRYFALRNPKPQGPEPTTPLHSPDLELVTA